MKFWEAATRGVLWKKVFLEISQNSQENTCGRVSFLIKLQVSDTFLQNTSGRLFLNSTERFSQPSERFHERSRDVLEFLKCWFDLPNLGNKILILQSPPIKKFYIRPSRKLTIKKVWFLLSRPYTNKAFRMHYGIGESYLYQRRSVQIFLTLVIISKFRF